MKTTLEIPDAVFRKAKARAAEQGIPLSRLVSGAVKKELQSSTSGTAKPWMKMAGRLKHLKKETARINRLIAEEFRQIEPEMWQ
jgi:hypothetical protein